MLGLAGFIFHEPVPRHRRHKPAALTPTTSAPKTRTGPLPQRKRPRTVPRAFEREEFDKPLFKRRVVLAEFILDAGSDIELVHVDIDAVVRIE